MPPARVVYEAAASMTRGEAEAVAAAVTLDVETPAPELLHRDEAVGVSDFRVSCSVQARLKGSPYQFDVDRPSWVSRSLLTADTARWSWFVTPKIGGEHVLLLQIRPIVKIDGSRGVRAISASRPTVQEFETIVVVEVPWNERLQETMSKLAQTFKVGEGLVKAVTGFVTAVVALLAVLGIRRLRRRTT